MFPTNEFMKKDEIQLWCVRLAATSEQTQRFYDSLSNDEQGRARALHFVRHRTFFIIARGLLRAVLGWHLGQSAKDVKIAYGPRGKPSLSDTPPQLHFNLAHSQDHVLYAVSKDRELGVDLELVRELPDAEAIAAQFFANDECTELFSLPRGQRTQAFFNCWTRKEAYLKATGSGLSAPLNKFRVSLIPGQPAEFLEFEESRFLQAQWSLSHLSPSEGYVGALALASREYILQELQFRDVAHCLEYMKRRPG
jgi:4'-phosphopantetheinyl transferase